MTNIISPMGAAGRGLFPSDSGPFPATFSGAAVAVGNIVMFDPGLTTNPATPGDGSRYEICTLPATAGLARGIFGVVVDAGSGVNGARIKVSLYGRHTITTDAGDDIGAGVFVIPVNANAGVTPALGSGGAKRIAITEAADVDAANTVQVLFNGVEGWGYDHA